MTKKEYKEIMREISANTISHTYKALDFKNPHEESISVIEFEKVMKILNSHIKRGEKGKRGNNNDGR